MPNAVQRTIAQGRDMMDITAPKAGVQIEIRADSKVVWISVDGITICRICQIPDLEIIDNRSEK